MLIYLRLCACSHSSLHVACIKESYTVSGCDSDAYLQIGLQMGRLRTLKRAASVGKIGGVQARGTLEHTLRVEIADREEAIRELRWVL